MLGRDIIGSIKGSIKNRNSSAKKLGKVNEKLSDTLENSSNISKIEEDFGKELFGVFNPNHIYVDANLFDIIKSIGANLGQIKKKSVLEARIEDIKFDGNAMKINGITIDSTQGLSYLNPSDTQDSINKIEKSDQNLTRLEKIIPELEKRFNGNIKILENIRNEQRIFTGIPRELNDIDENLNEILGLKEHIGKITTLLSSINDALQKKNITAGDEESGEISPSRVDNEKLDNYLKIFNDEILNVESITRSAKWDSELQKHIQINDGKIDDVNDINEINQKQDFYSSRLDDINQRIEELKHEKALRENINQLDQLQRNPISIPDGFLPFGSDDTIAREGYDSETTGRYIVKFNNLLTQLNNFKKETKNIHRRYRKNKEDLEKIFKIQKFHETINNGLREKEIESIIDICQKLHLGDKMYNPRIKDQVTKLGGNSGKIELNFIDGDIDPDKSIKYSLCDKEGNSFVFDGDKNGWMIDSKDKNPFYLKGITFDNDNQTMKIENLGIDPIESISFPLELNLNVNISVEDKKTGLIINHNKPIYIEITRPKLAKNERKNIYSGFETTINEKIKDKYSDSKIKHIEDEIIRKILREGGNKSEVDKVYNNTARKKLFVEKIRSRLVGCFPTITIDKLKDGFKEDMTREDRHISLKYLMNEESFKEYINNNWENNLEDYTTSQIYESLSKHRDDIFSCFFGPQKLSDDYMKFFKKTSENNNYTKFLVGKSYELNDKESKIDDKTRIKYSVRTEVTGVNTITTTIKIGSKKPEIIEAKNHNELIEIILNKSASKDGEALPEKLRCDIAISVLKSMIAISPQMINRRTPNQKYFDGTDEVTCNRIEALTGGDGNLKLIAYKINTKNQDRTYVNVFDEGKCDSVDELKKNIWKISAEINNVLNSLAQDYQEAVYGDNRSLLKYNTAEHLKGGDIKRWWGKLWHGETNNDFNFDTEVDDLAGKKIRISFNQGRFTVSGEFEGEPYTESDDNLGDILRKRINKKRIFDGVELSIIKKINEKYVQVLRSNNLIKDKNYFVSDVKGNRTGRIYIFDAKGNLSYLEIGNEGSKLFGILDAGNINSSDIPSNKIICDEEEKKEFFENPILAGKLIREMKRSLTLLHSKKASEGRTKRRNRRESFKKMSISNKIRFIRNRFKKSTSNLLDKIYEKEPPKLKKFTSKLFDRIHKKESPRYSVDTKKIDENIIKSRTDPNFKINYNTDEKHIKYKMGWDLEFTADYLNGKISSKKYLKALGLSLKGFSDEDIKAEADRRAEMYKPYLDDNKKS